jgi:hypothetical protein
MVYRFIIFCSVRVLNILQVWRGGKLEPLPNLSYSYISQNKLVKDMS